MQKTFAGSSNRTEGALLQSTTSASGGLTEESGGQRPIAVWLFLCCALVFAMVVLGGVTRLTGSGLSMVNWAPVVGVVPPLTQADWETEFAGYKASPEYQQVNLGMTLEQFKRIYWMEYAHRLLGRTIGIVFLIPFLYFWWRGRLDRSLFVKLLVLFLLGGTQGLLGWYMVKSGLVDEPRVSAYRLTAHLGLALLIYGYMLWVAFGLWTTDHAPSDHRQIGSLRLGTWAVGGLAVITILSGGFVAGLKAGLVYNTFPLMNGRWIPEGMWVIDPLYRNLFENATTVQFDHRLLAIVTFVSIGLLWLRALRLELGLSARVAYHLLLAAAVLQVSLGITTLLLQVPIPLAAMHQAGALLLFTVLVFIAFRQSLARTGASCVGQIE